MNIIELKKGWRKRITKQKQGLSQEKWQEYSRLIQERLTESPLWKNSQHIAMYYSVEKEVDTLGLMKQAWAEGKNVYLPKCKPADKSLTFYQVDTFDQLETVYFGIPEPIPERCEPRTPAELDLIIVPGLVFDHKGYRIGYGGGYYDRFLQRVGQTPLVSLAFPFQVTEEELPVNQYDLPVGHIFLPQDQIICR